MKNEIFLLEKVKWVLPIQTTCCIQIEYDLVELLVKAMATYQKMVAGMVFAEAVLTETLALDSIPYSYFDLHCLIQSYHPFVCVVYH